MPIPLNTEHIEAAYEDVLREHAAVRRIAKQKESEGHLQAETVPGWIVAGMLVVSHGSVALVVWLLFSIS